MLPYICMNKRIYMSVAVLYIYIYESYNASIFDRCYSAKTSSGKRSKEIQMQELAMKCKPLKVLWLTKIHNPNYQRSECVHKRQTKSFCECTEIVYGNDAAGC